MNHWYELEICVMESGTSGNDVANFYKDEYDRTDVNAGFDLYSSSNVTVEQTPNFIPFGVIVRMIKVERAKNSYQDYVQTDSHYWLVPRSSIYKSGLMMANSIGVIDKSYRGELKAPVWSMTSNSSVSRGDRLFQIVAPDMGWIRKVRIVKELPSTERGAGGFGSTGK
jgi:deoxyuridine 5'-triphosphate nucleotidohydrolase